MNLPICLMLARVPDVKPKAKPGAYTLQWMAYDNAVTAFGHIGESLVWCQEPTPEQRYVFEACLASTKGDMFRLGEIVDSGTPAKFSGKSVAPKEKAEKPERAEKPTKPTNTGKPASAPKPSAPKPVTGAKSAPKPPVKSAPKPAPKKPAK